MARRLLAAMTFTALAIPLMLIFAGKAQALCSAQEMAGVWGNIDADTRSIEEYHPDHNRPSV